ncbi:metalloendoproteinase 4-MMP-like [Eucalyptus grandis]|uniref:metalloendoproteinase 4-MMP-like n=1 Tax=Eucalyptus grandis TaxID=71139 RepID=UPI00192E8513|nr:metalloendoproteinase 4-MMP-like [Eucalyptus grandis]
MKAALVQARPALRLIVAIKGSLIGSLEGALEGQAKRGIKEVKRYLKALGYLAYENKNDGALMDDEFDETLKSLDADTVKQMSILRCGVPDFIRPRHASRNATEPNKLRIVLRCAFSLAGISGRLPNSISPMLSTPSPRPSVFQSWTHVTAFTFIEVSSDETPDVSIGFFSSFHGDSQSFDGTWRDSCPFD